MKDKILDFLKGLMYEPGGPSLTRSLAVLFAAAFLIGSFYLMVRGMHWDHYETFALITGGGGAGLQGANKFINSKFTGGDISAQSNIGGTKTTSFKGQE